MYFDCEIGLPADDTGRKKERNACVGLHKTVQQFTLLGQWPMRRAQDALCLIPQIISNSYPLLHLSSEGEGA